MPTRVLILGAGMVAPPLVNYLLEHTAFELTVADQDQKRPEKLLKNSSRGRALGLDMSETLKLEKEIADSDLVISLLPYTLHPKVAAICIEKGKNLLTASYAGEQMQALDSAAQAAGISILCELGLDPGLDHMEALRIVHDIESGDGRILGFTSFCGGLPAPEANSNPLGYKFSWSPMGVLLASKNTARYLKDGREIQVVPQNLFRDPSRIQIPGMGDFDGYPNRDSLPYKEIYSIPEAQTMLRGTLRYRGWCDFMLAASRLGLLDEKDRTLDGFTYRSFLQELLGDSTQNDLKTGVAEQLGLSHQAPALQSLEWLGFFRDEPLSLKQGSALDVLAFRMQEKMQYEEGERDMIVLMHEFIAEYPDGSRARITSTLVDYGIPGGDSAMARTVGLPVAITAKLMLLSDVIPEGVCIPVYPQIYAPVLDELKKFNIGFTSQRSLLTEGE